MKLTVGQYQQLYAIEKSKDPYEDKMIQRVAVATGKPESEVEAMPLTEFNAINRQITTEYNALRLNPKPISFLKANGRLYQINYKIGTLTAGQNTDIQWWLKEDPITAMDKILASVAVEVKRYGWIKLPAKKRRPHADIAADMQDVDFAQAYGCVVFFCKIFAVSIKSFLPSFAKQMKAKGKTKEEIQTFQTDLMKTLDGFTM